MPENAEIALPQDSQTATSDRFPPRSPWTDEQRDYIFLALIEAQNDVDGAMMELEKQAETNPRVRVPTPEMLKHFRRKELQDYLEAIVQVKCITRALELIDSKNEGIALGATNMVWNRAYGQPTKRIEVEGHISLSRLESEYEMHQRMLEEREDGTWSNPEDKKNPES